MNDGVGFTGTQRGMTVSQMRAVRELLVGADGIEFHHGDCIGGDSDAHDIADLIGMEIVIHPPINPSKRAWRVAKRILLPKEYIQRNHDIVDATQQLIATPFEMEEQLRSGTWATVRYARKLRRKIWLVEPDGFIRESN